MAVFKREQKCTQKTIDVRICIRNGKILPAFEQNLSLKYIKRTEKENPSKSYSLRESENLIDFIGTSIGLIDCDLIMV